MITDDLNIFFADFGVTVTSGAVSGMGILDMPGEVIVNNTVLSTDYSVTIRTADFGNLLYGASVVVDGLNYEVRDCLPVADGAFSVLVLSKLDLNTITTLSGLNITTLTGTPLVTL